MPVAPVLPVAAVDVVDVVSVVAEVDEVPVSVETGTIVDDVSLLAADAVPLVSDAVELVSLVVSSLLLQANISIAARAAALIHFMCSSYHSHELPFIRAMIFATSM
jgi:hypothetical protein